MPMRPSMIRLLLAHRLEQDTQARRSARDDRAAIRAHAHELIARRDTRPFPASIDILPADRSTEGEKP